ncbi:MAG TPA: 2-dehydro-3-deoxy-6-phosphogalactonate aldolase [Burkholderiaceae bacterium]
MSNTVKQSVAGDFDAAFFALPLVAILRGIRPDEVVQIGMRLYEEGFRMIEVPLNSPAAFDSIAALAARLPSDAILGAGTVMSIDDVQRVQQSGGKLIVMPHADAKVIMAAKMANMFCIPGAATPSEIFQALHAGADAVKLFPAELVTPVVLRAMRAVVPASKRLLPVGGITPTTMGEYRRAGASGFGLGSALYAPGMLADDVAQSARSFAGAWRDLNRKD